MVRAVIFDLDDTLYPEADFVRSGFAQLDEWCRKELGITGFEEMAWRLFSEGNRGNIFDQVFAQMKLSPGPRTIKCMVEAYRRHVPSISLPEDSVRCLQALQGRWKLGLITDGPTATQWNKISALGLRKFFDEIIVTEDLGNGFSKPHQRAYLEMEERFDLKGAGLVYVADNPAKDFLVPELRLWRTVRVVRETGLHRKVMMANPCDRCVCDLMDLANIVEGL